MADIRQNDDRDRSHDGPFPETQVRERPWEASETDRGPFERRSAHDRRGVSPDEDATASTSGERRRRWGRRKSDVLTTEARETLTERSRGFVQRFREPIIGLTLAGVAVPLINAGVNPATAPETEESGDASRDAAPETAAADLDEAVGDYWAEAEADVVRASTIEGAITRWGIDDDLATKIYDYATKNDIEPDIAYGLVFTESTFRERAVSHVGARGLTQLMPRTAQWLDPTVDTRKLFDPDVNLDIGFRYLRQLIDKYEGDLDKALTAYNRGPGTVDRILKRGGNPDNGYAGKVKAG